jgi:hypothetical protein
MLADRIKARKKNNISLNINLRWGDEGTVKSLSLLAFS